MQGCSSFVGGGSGNLINQGCSAIAGGIGNCNFSSHSSILGGRNNTTSGYPFVAVFGDTVNAVIPNALHIECLNLCTVPNLAALPPTGTFSWSYMPGIAATCRVLVWM